MHVNNEATTNKNCIETELVIDYKKKKGKKLNKTKH